LTNQTGCGKIITEAKRRCGRLVCAALRGAQSGGQPRGGDVESLLKFFYFFEKNA